MKVAVESVAVDRDSSAPTGFIAHIAHKAVVTEGYVTGRPVRSLCGLVLVPSRPPDGLPVCPECESTLALTASQR